MESLSPHVRDYLLIEDLATDDRPREKAMRNGIRSLSKAELIAIIFGNGIKGKSVLTMSQELLANNHGRLSVIARKSIKEIIKGNPGIGPAKAIALAAAIELGIRCQERARREHVVDTVCISQGGTSMTVVDPKILFKRVVEQGDIVSSIILVHNHPSGNLKPSNEDDMLTKKIKEGGRLLDIPVLDHLIITPESYYSYRDKGR